MDDSLPTLVSVDSHFSEPEDLWSSRLPEDLRYRAPAYRRVSNRWKLWVSNGRTISQTDEYMRFRRDGRLVAVAPLKADEPGVESETIERDDLEGRLKDLDADGVWAETIHPNVGLYIFDMDDPGFRHRCAQIYNDYIAERFQSERLIPNAIIPVQDVDWAVGEIERVSALGVRGLELPLTAPRGRPYFLEAYDRIWAAAQAHGLPVAMHAGTGKSDGSVSRAAELQAMYAVDSDDSINRERAVFAKKTATSTGGIASAAYQCFDTIPHIVASGALERFPDLHILVVETGASWLLFLMDSMDTAWTGQTVRRDVARIFFKADGSPVAQSNEDELFRQWPHPMLPSDYVRRQVHVGFMDDYVALRNREHTGTQSLVWGSDYPHYEGTWPESRSAIRAQAERARLSPDEMRSIFGGTVANLYGIRMPANA